MGKKITESEFNNIKLLQQAGLNKSKASAVTKRSWGSIDSAFKSKDYTGYLEQIAQNTARIKAQKELKTPQPEEEQPQETASPRPVEDTELLLTKVTNIENCLNELLTIFRDKEAKANVLFWRR